MKSVSFYLLNTLDLQAVYWIDEKYDGDLHIGSTDYLLDVRPSESYFSSESQCPLPVKWKQNNTHFRNSWCLHVVNTQKLLVQILPPSFLVLFSSFACFLPVYSKSPTIIVWVNILPDLDLQQFCALQVTVGRTAQSSKHTWLSCTLLGLLLSDTLLPFPSHTHLNSSFKT